MSASSHPLALTTKRRAADPPAAVVVPMEDTVKALINHLVAPLLPARAFPLTPPSQEEQKFVARQMHSVVLLYNYYHRKQFPHLVFLNFRSFCKQATISKPSLFSFMEFLHKNVEYSLDLDKELSIMEKEILSACNIATTLDALKNSTSMNRWPVSKVAVLLVNADQEKCYLEYGSITQGIWSLPERRFDKPIAIAIKSFSSYYSKKSLKKSLQLKKLLQQCAISAVQQKTGDFSSKFCVLEEHRVYSLNDEETTTMLYIMKSPDAVNGALVGFSIKDVLSSLRGPLVKAGLTPEVTSVVAFYYLLPYVDILFDWLSRVAPKSPYLNSSPRHPLEVHNVQSRVDGMNFIKRRCPEEGDAREIIGGKDTSRRFQDAMDSYHLLLVLVGENLTSENIDEFDPAAPSKKHEVVHASLRILQKRLNDSVREHRHLGDELAQDEMKIKTILSGELDVESVIQACSALCSSQTHTCTSRSLPSELQSQQEIRVRRFSEAILKSNSPCQELDNICFQNGWIIPRYCVFPCIANANECFQASVSVRGIDFEASVVGDFRSNPCEARLSAATNMINKLHAMSDQQALA